MINLSEYKGQHKHITFVLYNLQPEKRNIPAAMPGNFLRQKAGVGSNLIIIFDEFMVL